MSTAKCVALTVDAHLSDVRCYMKDSLGGVYEAKLDLSNQALEKAAQPDWAKRNAVWLRTGIRLEDCDERSSLSCVTWDSQRRSIFYQDKQGTLREWVHVDGSNWKETGFRQPDVLIGTNVAIVALPTAPEYPQIILFYQARDGNICYRVQDCGSWVVADTMPSAQITDVKGELLTGISACYNHDIGKICLYFQDKSLAVRECRGSDNGDWTLTTAPILKKDVPVTGIVSVAPTAKGRGQTRLYLQDEKGSVIECTQTKGGWKMSEFAPNTMTRANICAAAGRSPSIQIGVIWVTALKDFCVRGCNQKYVWSDARVMTSLELTKSQHEAMGGNDTVFDPPSSAVVVLSPTRHASPAIRTQTPPVYGRQSRAGSNGAKARPPPPIAPKPSMIRRPSSPNSATSAGAISDALSPTLSPTSWSMVSSATSALDYASLSPKGESLHPSLSGFLPVSPGERSLSPISVGPINARTRGSAVIQAHETGAVVIPRGDHGSQIGPYAQSGSTSTVVQHSGPTSTHTAGSKIHSSTTTATSSTTSVTISGQHQGGATFSAPDATIQTIGIITGSGSSTGTGIGVTNGGNGVLGIPSHPTPIPGSIGGGHIVGGHIVSQVGGGSGGYSGHTGTGTSVIHRDGTHIVHGGGSTVTVSSGDHWSPRLLSPPAQPILNPPYGGGIGGSPSGVSPLIPPLQLGPAPVVPADGPSQVIRRIYVDFEQQVKRFRIVYQGGADVTTHPSQGGTTLVFDLGHGEYITHVWYTANNNTIQGVLFGTSFGRKSEWFGFESHGVHGLLVSEGNILGGLTITLEDGIGKIRPDWLTYRSGIEVGWYQSRYASLEVQWTELYSKFQAISVKIGSEGSTSMWSKLKVILQEVYGLFALLVQNTEILRGAEVESSTAMISVNNRREELLDIHLRYCKDAAVEVRQRIVALMAALEQLFHEPATTEIVVIHEEVLRILKVFVAFREEALVYVQNLGKVVVTLPADLEYWTMRHRSAITTFSHEKTAFNTVLGPKGVTVDETDDKDAPLWGLQAWRERTERFGVIQSTVESHALFRVVSSDVEMQYTASHVDFLRQNQAQVTAWQSQVAALIQDAEATIQAIQDTAHIVEQKIAAGGSQGHVASSARLLVERISARVQQTLVATTAVQFGAILVSVFDDILADPGFGHQEDYGTLLRASKRIVSSEAQITTAPDTVMHLNIMDR